MPAAKLISPGQMLGSVALRYRQPAQRPALSVHWPHKVSALSPFSVFFPRQDSPVDVVGTRSLKVSGLEAVLFLAREPMGSRKLALLSGLADGTEARTLVRTLNRLYDEEGCAFRVVEVAGGFQLVSRAKFAPWLRRLQIAPTEVRLSAPALETLAVVAYRQPVLRADIEAVRGVQCGEILRQLMERGLVRIVGKSEDLGRPFLYGTTRLFLQTFGLRDLDGLPRPEWYRCEAAATEMQPAAVALDNGAMLETVSQPTCSNSPGGDVKVKTLNGSKVVEETDIMNPAASKIERSFRLVAGREEHEDEDAEELDDEDELDDDEEDEEDEDYDDDEEFDDEDFEDSDWEEVEDDEEAEEEGEEELDEDEDWEEDEEEDWDDEEDDDEEEDWEEEEEEGWE
jgi:segregation and condensation protein B